MEGYCQAKERGYVTAKLGRMRKPQRFLVTRTDKGNYLVQSDKSIGMFDPTTHKGVLNTRGCFFPHLERVMGAVSFVFPPEFVEQCQESRMLPGDDMSGGRGIAIYAGTEEIG